MLEKYEARRKFILCDSNTAIYCLPVLLTLAPALASAEVITVAAGEENKCIATAVEIWAQLLALGADRQSMLINLGGGMVSDLGGFVAASFMRGIDFINMPTTLLAQVDAAIGGKTGINLNSVKNIIGAFAPALELINLPVFLQTLPPAQVLSGFAEMIKHALIDGGAHWQAIKQCQPLQNITAEIIALSVACKTNICAADPNEKGRRKALNAGHTIGHAIESLSMKADKQPLLHGHAVAIGLYYEAQLAENIGLLKKEIREEIQAFIRQNYEIPAYAVEAVAALIDFMRHDKKNSGAAIAFSLPADIGDLQINIFIDTEKIKTAFL
jgi:3-dehydroquinate synthase